jgi:hypothetical protein
MRAYVTGLLVLASAASGCTGASSAPRSDAGKDASSALLRDSALEVGFELPPVPDAGADALAVDASSANDAPSAQDARPMDAGDAAPPPANYAAIGQGSFSTMTQTFYAGTKWNICVPDLGCGSTDQDWGADSLTYALYLRWELTADATIPPILSALNAAGPVYGNCTAASCNSWSDVPSWDSIAASREYEVTGEPSALSRAKAAFDFVDSATEFALGACPTINYQLPNGQGNQLKTLETDSNYIKAALLLYASTGSQSYLTKAMDKYASVRQYFLDPSVPLYTVYVVDTGSACTQIPRRFFASVNGNMILNGLLLADATGMATYHSDALATAQATASLLSDPSGIFENLQAENDVVEPLVEAFYRLATNESQAFARAWILANASAAASDLTADGTYGRFWGGPAPLATTTIWQTNGGFALAFAAAALAPTLFPSGVDIWSAGVVTQTDITTLPTTLTFEGSAIALFGTIGENCCESGHAQLSIDGSLTFDQTGIWQDKSVSGHSIPNSVLFAWRWPTSGMHTLGFEPGVPNSKEGTSFLHVQAYEVVP